MEPFEQKLKEYFDQVQPDADFIERLKGLENGPVPQRRFRRWVTPVAAAVFAVAALGSGWAYLRASLPGRTEPENAPAIVSYASAEAPAPELPAAAERPETGAAEPALPDPSQKAQPPAPKTPEPRPEPPSGAAAPADAPPADSPPYDPPIVDTEPYDPAPEPGALPGDEFTPSGSPEENPPKKPEEKPDPPEELPGTAGAPIIFAQYQTSDSRETLTLSNLFTGQTAEVDVTGQLPPPPQGEISDETDLEAAEPVTCTGHCSAFGWQIRYTLMQTGSGTVYAVALAESPE